MRDFRLKLLLGWVTFHLVFSWLPLLRCTMDGDSYSWGTSHFGHMLAPPWSVANRRLLWLFVLLLPLQFVLLRFGEPHGTTDAIGVLLTIAQCPLFTLAVWPWGQSRG